MVSVRGRSTTTFGDSTFIASVVGLGCSRRFTTGIGSSREGAREGGIIFNLVEDVVCETHGEHGWDQLLADAGLEGGYASIGHYPDEHLHALVGAASAVLDVPPDQVVRQLGYRSRRALCARAEGRLGGAASYYDELASVSHEQCTHRGDAVCLMRCRFEPERTSHVR